jgi:hypothetical protein
LVRRDYAASTIRSYIQIVWPFREHAGARLDRLTPANSSWDQQSANSCEMPRPAGLEPATPGLDDQCAIHLSYGTGRITPLSVGRPASGFVVVAQC